MTRSGEWLDRQEWLLNPGTLPKSSVDDTGSSQQSKAEGLEKYGGPKTYFTARVVAVKRPLDPTPGHVEKFLREARNLRRLIGEPHVIQVLDVSADASDPHFIMEFAQGSLDAWVNNRRPWDHVAWALECASEGLRSVHSLGGFHRDVKPANLLLVHDLANNETVKVGDLGLARVPSASSGPLTQTAWGTPGYVAPEILAGRSFSQAADVYSLAMTALQLLAGSFDPDALDALALPSDLRALIRRMAALDPAGRPRVDEVTSALAQIRNPAPPPVVQPSGNTAGVAGLLGVLLGIGVVAAATANTRDANGRYRGSDGRFRGGRWS